MATWPTITDDDGSGTTGTILDDALFDSIRDYIGTAWTAVAFSAGNFTANVLGTWTVASGDQAAFQYVEIGKTMVVSVKINTSTVGGTPDSELRITVPNGRTIAGYAEGPFVRQQAGTMAMGVWLANGGDTFIRLRVDLSGTVWSSSTDATFVSGTFVFEIV